MAYRGITRIAAAAALAVAVLVALSAAAPAASLGQFCGGILSVPCDGGLFCELSGGRCGAGDFGGTCGRVTQVCARIYRPVCGCNGKTYGNDCERKAARVSLRHEGRC